MRPLRTLERAVIGVLYVAIVLLSLVIIGLIAWSTAWLAGTIPIFSVTIDLALISAYWGVNTARVVRGNQKKGEPTRWFLFVESPACLAGILVYVWMRVAHDVSLLGTLALTFVAVGGLVWLLLDRFFPIPKREEA